MSKELAPPSQTALAVEHAAEEARRAVRSDARAPATRLAYRVDWEAFTAWCGERGRAALPADPTTVEDYLIAGAAAGKRASTLRRRLSSIVAAHRFAGHPSPADDARVRATWAGLRRRLGVAPHRKAPVMPDALRAMLATCDESLRGLRDRALLLVGFYGAFRRSEIVALAVADVVDRPEGLEITLRRSKTDQEGRGKHRALPAKAEAERCPRAALRAWLDAAGVAEGPLFRRVDRWGRVGSTGLSARTVARIVQDRAALAGLGSMDFAGHSLRAGFATAAGRQGVPLERIADQLGHTRLDQTREYVRDADLFTRNAGKEVDV